MTLQSVGIQLLLPSATQAAPAGGGGAAPGRGRAGQVRPGEGGRRGQAEGARREAAGRDGRVHLWLPDTGEKEKTGAMR